MLNLFQHLFIRCKDVKRQRCEAVIKNKFCCNFTKIAINENSPCPPVFCSSDLTHPFTSPPLKGGEKESSPLPSPIGEGATHVAIDNSRYFLSCHCECAAQFCQDKESLCKTQVSGAAATLPSQSQASCNNDEITTSNAPHSTRNNTRQSYIYKILKQVQDDIYSLKRTYRPNVLSPYRLKNKHSSPFTLHL